MPLFSNPSLPFPDDTLAVRYIHGQTDAQADAQAELDRRRTRKKELEAIRKERLLNDPEYRERHEDKKRKRIESDPLRLSPRKHADKMAKIRKLAKEAQDILNAQEREDMIEKVRERYSPSILSNLTLLRIAELDAQFSHRFVQ